jgi:hypothetical protein
MEGTGNGQKFTTLLDVHLTFLFYFFKSENHKATVKSLKMSTKELPTSFAPGMVGLFKP